MTSLDRADVSNARQPRDAMARMKDIGAALRPTAERYARQIGRGAQPALNHVRRNPVPYALGALALGALIGLAMSRTARNAVGETLGRAWDMAGDSDLLSRVRR